MNANVIIAVAAVAVTLFTVVFIVVEQQMGFEDAAIYYGAASGGGHSFNFAKTASGPFIGWEEDGVGSILIASVETGEAGQVAKIIWNADGSLQACDVEPTNTAETMAEWKAAPAATSGMGFVDPVTGVEYTYTVTEGEAPADWVKSVPTIDDCRATLTEDSASRFLTDTIGDEVERGLYTNEGRMASAAYKSCTYSYGNACVIVEGCNFAFRGSDDLWDWVSNIAGSVASVKVNGQWMHSGFYLEFWKVRSQINSKARSCGHSAKWIGHSLGGAMANVARQYYGKGTVHTFGAPASYDGKSSRFSGSRMWHDCDPVPSWALALGRHHAHGSTKVYEACTKRSWWGKCTRHSLRKTGAGYDQTSWFGGSFGAHSMDQYKDMS